MRELEILLKGDIELAPQALYILRSRVLLHVSHVGNLPWRHGRLLSVLTRSAPLKLSMHHVLKVTRIMRMDTHAKHRRVVLMGR